MHHIITTIGIIVVVIAAVFTAAPSLMRRLVAFAREGKHCYIGGVVRIVIGVLLVWTSPTASFIWIPLIIGSMIILSGVLIFSLGLARVHAVLDWWAAKTDTVHRVGSITAGVLGALLIYAA